MPIFIASVTAVLAVLIVVIILLNKRASNGISTVENRALVESTMLNQIQFAERFGDPASYTFNGAYFDTGIDAKMKCGVCSRSIRYCYIVKRRPESVLSPSKLNIGSCCFGFFEADPKMHQALQDAQGVSQHRAEAIEIETKFYARRADVKTRMEQWRQIRHQALLQVRSYRKASGKEWLPEHLFDLSVTATQEPPTYKRTGTALRWYEEQTRKLEEQISKVLV